MTVKKIVLMYQSLRARRIDFSEGSAEKRNQTFARDEPWTSQKKMNNVSS